MRRIIQTSTVTAFLGASSCLAFSPLATRSSSSTTSARLDNRRPLYASDPNQWLNEQLPVLDAEIEPQEKVQRKPNNPTPALVSAWNKSGLSDVTTNRNPAASLMLGLTLMLATVFSASNPALAAMSGGRVGGGGYGRPSMSRPAPSRSAYSGSYRGGGYGSRTNVYVNPGPRIFAPPIISPFAPVVPFSPFGGGVAVARGPSFFDLLFFGAVALTITNTIRGFGESTMDSWNDVDAGGNNAVTPLGRGTSVAQISVAMQVPNRDDPQSILNVLPRLARSAQTERRAGLQNLTSQVALELLRRKSQIISASTDSQHYRDRTRAEQAFGQRSIQERSKFEKESFSRFRGGDWTTSVRGMGSDSDGKATMAVVTLLIEIDGDATKLPGITNINSVEDALRKIASDSRVGECLQSAEILWTPEDRSELLTEREVVADYPELRSV